MIRLVSIPDAVINTTDLATWLMFPPQTLGFGYIPIAFKGTWTMGGIFTPCAIARDSIFNANKDIQLLFRPTVLYLNEEVKYRVVD